MTVEDPFPADEMDLLAYTNQRTPDDGLLQTFGAGIQKRLTRDLGLSISGTYDQNNHGNGTSDYGFENVEATLKYAVIRNSIHEAILSAGFSIEIGGSGTKPVADSTSIIKPRFFFGKGFGDLPESLTCFRPFAITGTAGIATPLVNSSDPGDIGSSLDYGITLMYSTMYLQSFVKDIGLSRPFSRTIPIVEFSFSSQINGPNQGATTATANPGFLWIGKYVELGVEAIIPMNNATGSRTGVQALVHLFLDDIASQIFTRTPFGGTLGPTEMK